MKNLIIGVLAAYILTISICEISPFTFFISMSICLTGLMMELDKLISYLWNQVMTWVEK